MGLFDTIKQQAQQTMSGMAGNQEQQPNGQQWQQQQTPPPAPQPAPQVAPQQEAERGGIYGDYIEHLIDMALADGELTEKEKQVLFKKAEAAGIDLDEFEMVLDARLFEKQKSMKAPQPQAIGGAAPKSDKYGDVKKCPSCGAMIESFTTSCPECGYEFRNIDANASISLLFKKLEEIEASRKGNFISAFSSGFGGGRIIKQKQSLISSFPIPTTKEDILEFLAMGVPLGKKKSLISNILDGGRAGDEAQLLRNVWREKCAQVIMKARFSMKDDSKTLAEIESYAKELGIK